MSPEMEAQCDAESARGVERRRETGEKIRRAAIEALARRLSDDDWYVVFKDVGAYPGIATHDELLAHLDEVWAGLTKAQREWAAVLCEDGFATTNHRAHSLVLQNLTAKHLATNLIDRRPTPTWVRQFEPLPLGRAVLKRAKEQGRG